MREKTFLLNATKEVLERHGYDFLETYGCFDLIAKKKQLLLLKILSNIDGLLEKQALSLRNVSYYLSAYAFIISRNTNRRMLEDGVVYFRFGIPVVTLNTFEGIIEREEAKELSLKGKKVVEIDTELMRKRRQTLNYSLKQLAKIVGISKKALYEIEKNRVRPKVETAEKLESVLGVKLIKKVELKPVEKAELKPVESFQMFVSQRLESLGIENSAVFSRFFNLIGKRNKALLSIVEKKPEKEKVDGLEKVAKFIRSFAIVFSQIEISADLPVITQKELEKVSSFEELLEKA